MLLHHYKNDRHQLTIVSSTLMLVVVTCESKPTEIESLRRFTDQITVKSKFQILNQKYTKFNLRNICSYLTENVQLVREDGTCPRGKIN